MSVSKKAVAVKKVVSLKKKVLPKVELQDTPAVSPNKVKPKTVVITSMSKVSKVPAEKVVRGGGRNLMMAKLLCELNHTDKEMLEIVEKEYPGEDINFPFIRSRMNCGKIFQSILKAANLKNIPNFIRNENGDLVEKR